MGRAEDIFEKIKIGGESAIDEFILTRKAEELFLDFKRSSNDGEGEILNLNDRENLAKAISGFGNSEGGVIVWGIDCSTKKGSGDVAHTKHPIKDVKKFLSLLEGAVSGCTIPPHINVQNHPVKIEEKSEGFVITYIPKSDHVPHRVAVKGKYQHRYYIRAGSNFDHTPHDVLAGMFGRRPQPNVFHNFVVGPAQIAEERIHLKVGFLIRNSGPGMASDLFMHALVLSDIGEKCSIAFDPDESKNWWGHFSFGRKISMITKSDLRVPPESELQPFTLVMSIYPPFSRDLLIECSCGCGQSPLIKFKIKNDRKSIEKLYLESLEKEKKDLLSKKDKQDLTVKFLKI
jgi:hypothetical protein